MWSGIVIEQYHRIFRISYQFDQRKDIPKYTQGQKQRLDVWDKVSSDLDLDS